MLGLALAALIAQVTLMLVRPGAEGLLFKNILTTVVIGSAAIATILAGIGRATARERAPWLALGIGLLLYAFAFAFYFFFQKTLTVFPTTADLLWLSFYPGIVVAIALLVRRQRSSNRLGLSLDAGIVALAVGALGYEVIFDRFLNLSQASDIAGGQLSFSVLDFGMLIMLVLACAPSRLRVGRAYFGLTAGMLLFLGCDIELLKRTAFETYVPGTLLDAGWSAGALALALSSQLGSSLERVNALRGRALYATVTLSFGIAVALLIEESSHGHNPAILVPAGLTLVLILFRLFLSVRENDRLARDKEGMISAAGDGILRLDRDGAIEDVNPAALMLLGYSREETLGRPAEELIHRTRADGATPSNSGHLAMASLAEGTTQRVSNEIFQRKDGTGLPVDYTCAPLRENGRVVGSIVIFDDVSGPRRLQKELRQQAAHDSLTGLYNRRRFEEETGEQLSYAKRYGRAGALLMLDLDAFKFVNDSFGHPAGDELLRSVAAILRDGVRESDVVARLGGDEFAVLLREADRAAAEEVGEGLIAAIRAGSTPTVGASIGIATFDGSSETTPDDLLVSADIALYEAKETGGAVVVHSGGPGRNLTWVERIREALDEGRLAIYAQPIIELRTGEVVREELLIRMLDVHGDKIPPAAFLPAAERFGLIQEIDLEVLGKAIGLAGRGKPVAVNVSARTLTDTRVFDTLERAIADGVDPARLSFEITETAAASNIEDARKFAERVTGLGCTLGLDDFGTGFSSIAYLKHIPAQYLKIDMEFIQNLENSPADQRLVEAIVEIARSLGQQTVAEGVESAETLATLHRIGVDYGQGNFIGRAEPIKAFGASFALTP